MKYKKLNTTNIDVSMICLGTMTFGEQNTQYESFEQMDYAVDNGINFFDTAELYPIMPRRDTYGETEKIIGNWFKERKNRDKIILASKIASKSEGLEWIREGKENLGFNKKNMNTAIDNSLKRLQTDYVDLYQLHSPTLNDLEENSVIQTLDKFKVEGKIKEFGVSVRSPDDALVAIKKYGFPIIQVNFNMIDQRALDNGLFEIANQNNIGIIIL